MANKIQCGRSGCKNIIDCRYLSTGVLPPCSEKEEGSPSASDTSLKALALRISNLLRKRMPWLSVEAYVNPLSTEIAVLISEYAAGYTMEPAQTSHNKPMPKLPTLEEVYTSIQCGPYCELSYRERHVLEACYEFIGRQLSA